MQGLADRDRTGTPVTEQRRQRRYVGVGPQYPGHIGDVLLGGGPAGAGQHVRFGVHPGHGTHPGGDRQGQLAGPAAKINHYVVTGKPERAGQLVDHSRRVAAPVLMVEIGHLTTET